MLTAWHDIKLNNRVCTKYMGHSKSNDLIKFLYFRQLVLNKILDPDVLDYGDSKSESWHRAKKVFMVNKSASALCP